MSDFDINEPLRMSDLVAATGVSASTIRYYVREGLLGEIANSIVRTGRNMAYYPSYTVDRIVLIKRLQEERFMPLKVIRELLERDPLHTERLLELEDRLIAKVSELRETRYVSRERVLESYDLPEPALDRLEQLGVLSRTSAGYDQDDISIIESISRFRAGGYEQTLGFTVYDTVRYLDALRPLVAEEVTVLLDRLTAGDVETERAVAIVQSGVEPLRNLLGAIHSKLLTAELDRRRDRSDRD